MLQPSLGYGLHELTNSRTSVPYCIYYTLYYTLYLVSELPRRGELAHTIFIIGEEEEPFLEYLHADIVHFVLEFSGTVHLD